MEVLFSIQMQPRHLVENIFEIQLSILVLTVFIFP